jgi:hypothetical protein
MRETKESASEEGKQPWENFGNLSRYVALYRLRNNYDWRIDNL